MRCPIVRVFLMSPFKYQPCSVYSSNLDSTESFTQHYGSLIQAVLQNPLIQGFCYTQLTDVMQEKNGLLDENHCPKIDIKEVAKSNRIVQQ